MISTVSSVTRLAPTVVGTAMNTIMSRMGGLKLGETLEDGVDLNKYSATLKKVGIDVLDATGNLREMGDLSKKRAGEIFSWENVADKYLELMEQATEER